MTHRRIAAHVLLANALALSAWSAERAMPQNLAPKAKVSASTEHSAPYSAKRAVDGLIPEASKPPDTGAAWACKGSVARDRATFTLAWDEPVTVAQVIYYGRVSPVDQDSWRDFELWLDDATQPAAKGTLKLGWGPQPIAIPPRQVRRVTLKFLNSYGGPNPGASEIQVFARPVPPELLPKFQAVVNALEFPGVGIGPPSPELARAVREQGLGFGSMLVIERHALNPSHTYTASCEGFRPGGGLSIVSPPRPDGRLTKVVASPDGMIMDYDLSFDAAEIVFSWRRNRDEGYHIYRVKADGSGLKKLTDGPWHDYNACWLPDGSLVFLSTRAVEFTLCFSSPSGVLYRMDRDGGSVVRLSANLVNDFTPSVYPDGRILYSRWEYVDKGAVPIQSLWTMRPDGTGLSLVFGNAVLSPASFFEAQAVPGTRKVLCTLAPHNRAIRGAVGLVDRVQGFETQAAILNLTPQVNIGKVNQGNGNHVNGPFEGPFPIDGRRFLVSRLGDVLLGDHSGRWAAVLPRGKSLGYYRPRPLRPRPRPPVVAEADPSPEQPHGTVYILDIYNGLEPHVERGAVKQICVVQEMAKPVRTNQHAFGHQRPVISCGATYATKKIWGTAPVEPDGSAHFRVPADVPIYFIALDAQGVAVQRMRSHTQLRPGERQGCIGCHEPRKEAPAIRQATAIAKPPAALEPPDWGVTTFDYPRVVQPVLDRYCTRCHSGVSPPKGIDLTGDTTDWFSVSYDVLTRGYVSWIDTRNGTEQNIFEITPRAWGSPASKLTHLVLTGHREPSGKPRVEMDPASRQRLFAWIDVNVPYYATYEMSDPSRHGGRHLYPGGLNARLADVAKRRCASCHGGRLPSRGFLRIASPERNDFLAAPLAKAAGGRGSCGKPVFLSKSDPDYQALLKTFAPLHRALAGRSRMDMPDAKPGEVSRCRLAGVQP